MLNRYDVFISYARADSNDFAAAITQELAQRGLRVFSDQGSLAPGQAVPDTVERALSGSRAIILLLSPASAGSQWMNREIAHAIRKQTNIIPVVLDRSALDSPIGTLLGDRDFIDVSGMPPPIVAKEVVRHLDESIFTSARLRRLLTLFFYLVLLALAFTLAVGVVSRHRYVRAESALKAAQETALKSGQLNAQLDETRKELQKSQNATRYVAEAINFYHARQYHRALQSYDQAITLDPNNPYIYDLKGYALFKLGQLEPSIATLRKSVVSDPNYAWGYFDLARVYCAAKDYRSARDSIASALRLAPELKHTMQRDGEFAHICQPVQSSFR